MVISLNVVRLLLLTPSPTVLELLQLIDLISEFILHAPITSLVLGLTRALHIVIRGRLLVATIFEPFKLIKLI